jgi:hypothetical protein
MLRNGDFERDPGQFFEWVKFRSHLSRGVTAGTMLQDEAFHFLRLGTFLERADNTARLVDVKFHAVQNDFIGTDGEKDQEYDFYHWSAILRSVSGFEVYRKVYRDVIKPERVAELLILRPDMPRSLLACLNEVMSNLAMVTSDTTSETQRRAGKLRADLQYARIDEILATGLHAFLTQFLDRVNEIGRAHQPRADPGGTGGPAALRPWPGRRAVHARSEPRTGARQRAALVCGRDHFAHHRHRALPRHAAAQVLVGLGQRGRAALLCREFRQCLDRSQRGGRRHPCGAARRRRRALRARAGCERPRSPGTPRTRA